MLVHSKSIVENHGPTPFKKVWTSDNTLKEIKIKLEPGKLFVFPPRYDGNKD